MCMSDSSYVAMTWSTRALQFLEIYAFPDAEPFLYSLLPFTRPLGNAWDLLMARDAERIYVDGGRLPEPLGRLNSQRGTYLSNPVTTFFLCCQSSYPSGIFRGPGGTVILFRMQHCSQLTTKKLTGISQGYPLPRSVVEKPSNWRRKEE